MSLLFFTHLLNGLLMIAMPIGLGIFLTRRFHLGWHLWWLGAATFVLSQAGHIPFNWLITRFFQLGILPAPPPSWKPYFYPIFLGLSAGLWEELSRYAVYHGWASDARSWRKGVLLGAGHGGIEAIIFGLLVLYTFFNMVVLRGEDLARIVPPEQMALAQKQIAAYWSAAWPYTMLGALERALTIPCHIAFSLLVLQAFTRRQPFWVGLAVLWHAVVDAVVVYFSTLWAGAAWGAYALEGLLGIAMLISIAIIFSLRTPEPEPPAPQVLTPAAPTPLVRQDVEPKITKEDLDQSRYL